MSQNSTPLCELHALQFCFDTAWIPILQDQGALQFRQLPTLEDCFPSSEKHYQPVLHEGTLLQVRGGVPRGRRRSSN